MILPFWLPTTSCKPMYFQWFPLPWSSTPTLPPPPSVSPPLTCFGICLVRSASRYFATSLRFPPPCCGRLPLRPAELQESRREQKKMAKMKVLWLSVSRTRSVWPLDIITYSLFIRKERLDWSLIHGAGFDQSRYARLLQRLWPLNHQALVFEYPGSRWRWVSYFSRPTLSHRLAQNGSMLVSWSFEYRTPISPYLPLERSQARKGPHRRFLSCSRLRDSSVRLFFTLAHYPKPFSIQAVNQISRTLRHPSYIRNRYVSILRKVEILASW